MYRKQELKISDFAISRKGCLLYFLKGATNKTIQDNIICINWPKRREKLTGNLMPIARVRNYKKIFWVVAVFGV